MRVVQMGETAGELCDGARLEIRRESGIRRNIIGGAF